MCIHTIPWTMISDRDPIFLSHFWTQIFKLQGTKLKMSSSYRPETYGQTAIINEVFGELSSVFLFRTCQNLE